MDYFVYSLRNVNLILPRSLFIQAALIYIFLVHCIQNETFQNTSNMCMSMRKHNG